MVIKVELTFRSLYMQGVVIFVYFSNYKEISDGILLRDKLASSTDSD